MNTKRTKKLLFLTTWFARKARNLLFVIIVGILAIVIVSCLYWQSRPYYEKYHHIAHALGAIEGLEYSNSKEALDRSYSKGIRLLEVDFLYTSDGHLVCRHNWNQKLEDGFSKKNIPDYETFMASKIKGVYTTLDIESIIQFAMDHPDVYFVTDIKSYKFDICEALKVIEETADEMGYTDLDKQFIVQVYNYEDYKRIIEEFSFENYIFTLYRMKDKLEENSIDEIVDFCLENDIKVVTLPQRYSTKEICGQFKENNIHVYAYTINSRRTWVKIKLAGVDGIYSDYIYPLAISRWFIKLMTLTYY